MTPLSSPEDIAVVWKAIFFYIMHILLENSLLLQLKNAGIM
jgi:hypothetical protein